MREGGDEVKAGGRQDKKCKREIKKRENGQNNQGEGRKTA